MAEVQKDKLSSAEDTLRFLDLVGLFNTQAMITLGKLANPVTGKAEKNLPAARLFIDMLEMLERKTQNNLTADETKVLRASLTDLRMMFVEESKASTAEKVEEQGPKTTGGAPKADVAPAETEADDAKVKFHKKYE